MLGGAPGPVGEGQQLRPVPTRSEAICGSGEGASPCKEGAWLRLPAKQRRKAPEPVFPRDELVPGAQAAWAWAGGPEAARLTLTDGSPQSFNPPGALAGPSLSMAFVIWQKSLPSIIPGAPT